MEVLDEAEWWDKMNQMTNREEQEMIIKRNFSRSDQQVLSDMAYQLGLYLYVYNNYLAISITFILKVVTT